MVEASAENFWIVISGWTICCKYSISSKASSADSPNVLASQEDQTALGRDGPSFFGKQYAPAEMQLKCRMSVHFRNKGLKARYLS